MIKRFPKDIFILPVVLFAFLAFNSCENNCKDEQIEKVEWFTEYKNVYVDTLVDYSIVRDELVFNDTTKRVTHFVSIKNNSTKYSNEFSVSYKYGYFSSYNKENSYKEYQTEYTTIEPDSIFTFEFERQANYYNNFNNSITVLQHSKEVEVSMRYDKLKTELITINTCVDNVDVLKEKYNTIKNLYNFKIDTIKLTNE
ncbi:MAG: hypothetical protein GKR88_08015 [Flavobacteriaceae bacterium]|nr:MAG: hypothetical protein GKR88_03900 [Flavobacteriaceae bacterium]QMU64241.1 MAG: hypothetical protein GKR88_08015 [Flavobacteriaceae bacterium]